MLDRFADALAAEMADSQGESCIVAGADLSHVGERFGDRRELTPSFLGSVEERDRVLLARLESADADGIYEQLAKDENPTRVCGGGSLYVMTKVLAGAPGKVLRYEQSVDRATKTCVTSAAVIFEDERGE